mgnify:CR=1 FL=1
MEALTGILDIVKNIGVISTLKIIKVTSTPEGVIAEAIDGQFSPGMAYAVAVGGCATGDKPASVICRGELPGSFVEFDGTIGLGRLSVLKEYLEFHKDSEATIVKETRGLALAPIEIKFDNGSGSLSWYRFSSGAMTREFVKIPLMQRPVADVTFSPDEKGIRLFNHWTRDAKKTNRLNFWPCMNARGKLYFSFDVRTPSNSTIRFEFASGLPFVSLAPYTYPAEIVAEILSLAKDAKSVAMSFSNVGELRIHVTSELGRYEFIVLGDEHLILMWNKADDWPQVYHIDRAVSDDASMHHDWEPEL